MFESKRVDEKNMGTAVARLRRVVEILKLLIEHIRVMETMTPLDFLDFRKYLFPASGFQSFQFRMVENMLGLPESDRMTYNNYHYAAFFTPEQQAQLDRISEGHNLFTAVEDWLERTPFLSFGDFKFLEHYKASVERMVEREAAAIQESDYLTEEEKAMRIRMMGNTDPYFRSILDPHQHSEEKGKGTFRLSYDAMLAALMINLYNEEPLLQIPYRFLLTLVDIDELLTTWRYRHAQMVLRMLGRKTGTGGSSGHSYLRETALKHHIFTDLHNISTLLIPRSELPSLPPHLIKQLGFYYTQKNED
jgi:tryptophan 2,3-dioxygenase